jgi:hypothetical protein
MSIIIVKVEKNMAADRNLDGISTMLAKKVLG